MSEIAAGTLDVRRFLSWAERQDGGRYELVEGEVVAMAPERARHVRAKLNVAIALRNGVRAAGLPFEVFGDGMTVKISDHTARGPDAIVQCGSPVEADSLIVDQPLILVEVLSPSSERSDTGGKLAEYFSLPSVRHYLIVDPLRMVVIHHARDDAGEIRTRLASDGELRLDPPGLSVALDMVFGEVDR